eukprot:1394002-Amorphochlora_amoeboformis.AAC.2
MIFTNSNASTQPSPDPSLQPPNQPPITSPPGLVHSERAILPGTINFPPPRAQLYLVSSSFPPPQTQPQPDPPSHAPRHRGGPMLGNTVSTAVDPHTREGLPRKKTVWRMLLRSAGGTTGRPQPGIAPPGVVRGPRVTTRSTGPSVGVQESRNLGRDVKEREEVKGVQFE